MTPNFAKFMLIKLEVTFNHHTRIWIIKDSSCSFIYYSRITGYFKRATACCMTFFESLRSSKEVFTMQFCQPRNLYLRIFSDCSRPLTNPTCIITWVSDTSIRLLSCWLRFLKYGISSGRSRLDKRTISNVAVNLLDIKSRLCWQRKLLAYNFRGEELSSPVFVNFWEVTDSWEFTSTVPCRIPVINPWLADKSAFMTITVALVHLVVIYYVPTRFVGVNMRIYCDTR